jgi:hypothetical protein
VAYGKKSGFAHELRPTHVHCKLKQAVPHVCLRAAPVQSSHTALADCSAEQPTWLDEAEVRLLQLRACSPCCLNHMQERFMSCCKLLAAGRCVRCKVYVSDV